MLRAYKYRIYPNKVQQKQIEQTLNACRLVYNLGLEIKKYAWQTQQKNVSSFDLCYQLIDLKKDFSWISDIDSQALQASVKKIDIAFKNFFRGNGYPKFKSKKFGHQSFQCPNNKRKIDWENSTLTIPKIKDIKIVLSRKFDGKIKTITISKTPTRKYFASILVDNGQPLPEKRKAKNIIGIDLGISNFAVLSNGDHIENPKYLKNSLQRLKVLQRRASKKVKGSNNRKKANFKVAVLHERISNQRSDFLHKTSTAITKRYDVIVLENLNISGMVKNHKLAQSITDCGWGMFGTFCKYKMDWTGGIVYEADTFEPSSKKCSVCGEINHSLTLKDREWTCVSCETLHNRDLNAAKNLKQLYTGAGSPSVPVEMSALAESAKQEVIKSVGNYQ